MTSGVKLRRTRPESKWKEHPQYPGLRFEMPWMSERRFSELMAPTALEMTGWRDQRIQRDSRDATRVIVACQRDVVLESVTGWEGMTGSVVEKLSRGEITIDGADGDTPEKVQQIADAVERTRRDGLPFSREYLIALLDTAPLNELQDVVYGWRVEWIEEVKAQRREGESAPPTSPGP